MVFYVETVDVAGRDNSNIFSVYITKYLVYT